MKHWNHYKCEDCGGVTIAFHENEGVTPFIIRCHAKDEVTARGHRIRGCNGSAQSNFFSGDQSDKQKPHVIFFRPIDSEAINWISKQPKDEQAGWVEHYNLGGSLMRTATDK